MSNETAQGLRPRAPATQGAAAEFERMYRANVDAVTAFFARRSADPQTVADLTADTFVAAITPFAAFNPGSGTARAWVFGIARRVYAGHCEAYAQQRGRVLRLAGRGELDADQVEELIGLSHLPGLKETGFTASRRLLDVQRISHDPTEGAAALTALTQPVISPADTRTAGIPLTSPRVQALLAALCAFRLLPSGFTNRDLRNHLAPLLGLDPEAMTSGQITYDLRRLRIHGLIRRIPHSFRYQVTLLGLRQALFLTRLTQRFLIPGLAGLTGPSPPADTRLRAAARAYDAALDDLARHAGLAA